MSQAEWPVSPRNCSSAVGVRVVEQRGRPAYDARKLDGREAEVTEGSTSVLEQLGMKEQNDCQIIEGRVSCDGDLTTDVWRTECSAMTPAR